MRYPLFCNACKYKQKMKNAPAKMKNAPAKTIPTSQQCILIQGRDHHDYWFVVLLNTIRVDYI
jgi:hypothetical protein